MKLKGKKALVTGGARGIGKGVAAAYLKEGASVIICGRNELILKAACNDLGKLGPVDYIVADISHRDDVARLAEEIGERWVSLDVLVNNASILGERKPIIDYPEDVWEEVVDINLNAQFYVTKALLPLLMKSENGSIINVSSSVGRKGKKEWGAYAASKFGVEALTQVLSDELGENGPRVNSVNPGGTRTGMRADAYPDEDPMSLPSPEDISPVFVYLASDESKGVTGREFNARDWIGAK
ncbi:MAG TPA: SDR family NAD(P)-dependent oxidoreductase [Thermodesulfobacteriota bacterium]|nr:SDR family NAD(P)-dependent oxidoreductase [Thermodesulfobacteriota bacterium]